MSSEETQEAFNWDAWQQHETPPERARTITNDSNRTISQDPTINPLQSQQQTIDEDTASQTMDVQTARKKRNEAKFQLPPLVTPDGTYKVAPFIQRTQMSALGKGKDYTVYASRLDLGGDPKTEEVFDAVGTLTDIVDKATAVQLGGGSTHQTRQTGVNAVKALIDNSAEKGIEARDAALYDRTRGLVTRYRMNRIQVSDNNIVEVAIKESNSVIFGESKKKKKGDSKRIRREIRELVQLLGLLDKHVIAPLAVYNSNGRAAVVTRKCNPIEDTSKLSYAQLAQGYAEVAKGVGVLHRLGMIHRDIKPDNMFLEYNPENPNEVWGAIADASIMKLTGRTARLHTMTAEDAGLLIGTPAFMAPEQVHGIVTYQSDIAGLGASLYFDLTGGELVNPGNDIDEIILNRYQGRYRPQDPRKIVENPEDEQRLEWLTWIMAASLIGDKDHMDEKGMIAQRYATVSQFEEDLMSVYQGKAPSHVQRIVRDNTKFETPEEYVSAVFSPERPECLPQRPNLVRQKIKMLDPNKRRKSPSRAKKVMYAAAIVTGLATAGYVVSQFLESPSPNDYTQQKSESGQ